MLSGMRVISRRSSATALGRSHVSDTAQIAVPAPPVVHTATPAAPVSRGETLSPCTGTAEQETAA
eukprot:10699958-Alexandrium_andersonii.AAC.1